MIWARHRADSGRMLPRMQPVPMNVRHQMVPLKRCKLRRSNNPSARFQQNWRKGPGNWHKPRKNYFLFSMSYIELLDLLHMCRIPEERPWPGKT